MLLVHLIEMWDHLSLNSGQGIRFGLFTMLPCCKLPCTFVHTKDVICTYRRYKYLCNLLSRCSVGSVSKSLMREDYLFAMY